MFKLFKKGEYDKLVQDYKSSFDKFKKEADFYKSCKDKELLDDFPYGNPKVKFPVFHVISDKGGEMIMEVAPFHALYEDFKSKKGKIMKYEHASEEALKIAAEADAISAEVAKSMKDLLGKR